MTAVTILAFYGTFFAIVLGVVYVSVILGNKKAKAAIDKFMARANELNPVKIEGIKLRYWTSSGMRTYISLTSYCDLYLFDNCVAFVRRSGLIFKASFAPVIITPEAGNAKEFADYLEVYKPAQITFNRFRKDEIEIKLPDPVYNHIKIDITLQGLTESQRSELEKIKDWC